MTVHTTLLKMDGYDDCVLGICERYGMQPVIAYDRNKVLKKLMKDGMTKDEAVEFFLFNQIGAWMGEGTPVFVTPFTLKQINQQEQENHGEGD